VFYKGKQQQKSKMGSSTHPNSGEILTKITPPNFELIAENFGKNSRTGKKLPIWQKICSKCSSISVVHVSACLSVLYLYSCVNSFCGWLELLLPFALKTSSHL